MASIKQRKSKFSVIKKEAIRLVEDDVLLLCMHLAFACSLRVGEITGLTWNDVIIDEKAIIKIFPTQKPHCTTRLVLKTPKTETSNRTVWLPTTIITLLLLLKMGIL